MEQIKLDALREAARKIRVGIIEGTHAAKSGHPGGSLSIADIMAYLYFEEMNIDPKNPKDPTRDRFVLSKGHTAPALYAALAERGFFDKEELKTLRKIDSRLQGHPDMKGIPGVDMTTGSLGLGISAACGMALSAKITGKSYYTYTILGDGECEEGQVWEAAMFAAHHKLDNLVGMVDWNGQQIDGKVDEVGGVGDLEAKFKAFGWDVIVADGHDFEEILKAYAKADEACGNGKPVMILFKSDMGHGVDFMAGTHAWHGKAPSAEQCANALAQLEETLGDF